jgi:V8-like Glu-specific endopeptidase
MIDPLLSRRVFARLALVLSIGLAVAAGARAPAWADWKDMNAVINATNFIVADQCSGTLISLKYKLVLTNNHCLQGYVDKQEKDETEASGEVKKVTREIFKDMELKQKSYQGFEEVGSASYQAKILFHVHKYDLAILQIKADALSQTVYSHILPLDRSVQRGDPIFVVGNPFMLDANLNEGHISSVNRKIQWDDGEDIPYFGVDAGVNPGNSGGALYNADGELIGVPGASMRGASGLGFAIPVTLIRKVLKDHCYEDVFNSDPAVKNHAACEQDKLDKENAIRVKAGLPPKEAPKDDDASAGTLGAKAESLILRPKPHTLGGWLESLPLPAAGALAGPKQ